VVPGHILDLRAIHIRGDSTFAEDPTLSAPDARIIWHADLDPGTLVASAIRTDRIDPESIDPTRLHQWLALVTDESGEHAVLSDGWRRIRIDIAGGSLAAGLPVVLHYHLSGVVRVQARLPTLRGLIHLMRHGTFARGLYPPVPRIARHLLALRVHDARIAGASQREIVETLLPGSGPDQADSLRSRIRRLAREARRLASGGWRDLMRKENHRY
jgi:hypothetical protein